MKSEKCYIRKFGPNHAASPALAIVSSCRGFSFNVGCKPLIFSCLFNGIAAMQSYPLPLALPSRVHAHKHTRERAQPPSHLAPLPYTQSSQAYQVCLCCCCWANEQCTKTKDQAKLLLSDPLWREEREGKKRQRGKESKGEGERQRWLTKVSLCFVKIYSYSHVRNRCRLLCMN